MHVFQSEGISICEATPQSPLSYSRKPSMSADSNSDTHVATCCCGALSVSFEGPPSIHFWCHCKDCQNWFGGFDVAEVLWPASDCSFRVLKGQGLDSIFSFTGNSERHFCKTCGTRVYGFSPKFQLYSTLAVSVPSVNYQPSMHVFCKDIAWQLPNDGLPHYKDLPAEFGGSGEVVQADLQVM